MANACIFLNLFIVGNVFVNKAVGRFLALTNTVMKNIYFSRESVFALIIVLSLSFISSCTKTSDDDDDNTYAIAGNANGSQEIPATSSTASATLSGIYDADNNLLQYTINWTGLSGGATGANFHGPASTTASAEVLFGITISTNGINGSATGTVTLTDSAETALLNSNVYYDVHTALYSHGEIRGQVIAFRE
jgi:hypothetical protein